MCALAGIQADAVSEASSQEDGASDGSRPAKKRRKSASKSAKGGGKTRNVGKGGKGSARGSPSPSATSPKQIPVPGGRLKRRRTSPEGTQSCLSHRLQNSSKTFVFLSQQGTYIQTCITHQFFCNRPLVFFDRSRHHTAQLLPCVVPCYCHSRFQDVHNCLRVESDD